MTLHEKMKEYGFREFELREKHLWKSGIAKY